MGPNLGSTKLTGYGDRGFNAILAPQIVPLKTPMIPDGV